MSAPTQQVRRYVTDDQSEVATPRLRTTARRALFWVIVAVVVVLIVIAGLALTGTSTSTARLSATNPKPVGAKALIQVLRTDGVHVTAPRTLNKALAEVGSDADPAMTTLVLYDQDSILNGTQLSRIGKVSNLVLIEPSFGALSELDPNVTSAGFVRSQASAKCSFGPAVSAGTVAGLGKGYRSSPDPNGSGEKPIQCFGTGGVYSLIRTNTGTSTVTVLGSTTLLDNDSIVRKGNAALALGLFGNTKNLVWYLPSFADYSTPQDNVIPYPPWVFLMFVLAGLVVVAAIAWRGRRFGPIVVERLPVVVRSSETVEGRARLYQKASARTHAIDGLRIGTLSRLATLCGLPKRASLEDVLGAVARATNRPQPELRALLVDEIPTSDSQFIRISDDLLQLEAEVAAATRPA